MEEVSQTMPSRSRQPWTDEEHCRAEELRAQGLTYAAIGRALGRGGNAVRCRIDPAARESMSESRRRWNERNPGKTAAAIRRWGDANKEKLRAYTRNWHRANKEFCRENSRRCRNANPDSCREYNRQWLKSNPELCCEQSRRRNALKRAARRRALIPVTIEQIRDRFALFGGCCAYCGSGERATVDHVLALKAGGLDEPHNIVPACGRCNSSKRAESVELWYRHQPFFAESRWRTICRHCPAASGQLSLALAA